MSRLWSRFGIRALSIALLLTAVAGGVSLSRDRDAGHRDDSTVSAQRLSDDEQQLTERAASRATATSRQRAAQREAAKKANEAARSAAQRARRVDDAAVRKKEEEAEEKVEKTTDAVPYAGPIPASCAEYSGNRKVGCALMLERGFAISQMPCLEKLWTRESGWNHRAQNSSTGAFGIPQALPGNKMASVGADWQSNPATQIKWGLGYIKDRYSTPCGAWQHFKDTGFY